jgi:hypothetical protein
MAAAIHYYEGAILFVHRDADREAISERHSEVARAYAVLSPATPTVAVVPVRMTEAWLLFDESAIRKAAGNPNGSHPLDLPPLRRIEDCPNPKAVLNYALEVASGLSGRRLKKFHAAQAVWRIAEVIEDFSPLRQLRAFAQFERAIDNLRASGWKPGLYF